jgi:hypothetical protein
MQEAGKLLERPVSNLPAVDLRAMGYECLEASKSQTDRALRASLLARGLDLAQLAESSENGKSRHIGPRKSRGTPCPDNPEA